MPLRGHRYNGKLGNSGPNVTTAENDGNFRHILRYRVQGGDSLLQRLVDTASGNTNTLVRRSEMN